MATNSVVVRFPKRVKRGRKVSRGPAAEIIQLAARAESPALTEAKRIFGPKYARMRDLAESFARCANARPGDHPRVSADEFIIDFASSIQEARVRMGRSPL